MMKPWSHPRPVVRPVRGGYLALTPPEFPYRIGVFGKGEKEAREGFEIELTSWEELRNQLEVLTSSQ
jgi:hypothetical protein